jgi:DNA (cytosine-5)-methyltransferase 1
MADCIADADATLEQTHAHLLATSSREAVFPGVPTGALLVPRRHARALSYSFPPLMQRLVGKRAARSHVLRRARPVAGDWLLIHLSSDAAGLCDRPPPELSELLQAERAEYFPGVRLHDAFFERAPAPAPSSSAAAGDGGGRGFRFVELFAGIGGFRMALEPLGGRCVFASEINQQARETYGRRALLTSPLRLGFPTRRPGR